MSLFSLQKLLKPLLGRQGNAAASLGVHDGPSFRVLLDKERSRSERNGTCFSLILFQVEDREGLIETLGQRLRATDETGLLQDHIGVILPGTDAGGASLLAEDVCQELELESRGDAYTVFQYPDVEPPDLAEKDDVALNSGRIESLGVLFIQPLPLWKRSLDIVGAALGLALLSPLLLLTAVAIRLTSPGPVLFSQRRRGLGGHAFTIYKFRTMCMNAEAIKDQLRDQSEQDGPAFKLENDPRVIPIGRFLRKSCIDELPQLWNVLLGDMSLVGPRPLPCDESDQCQVWEKRRLNVTPGLTCIWQVDGGSHVSFRDWMRMDIRYINRRSARYDVKILWKTLVEVLLHRASH